MPMVLKASSSCLFVFLYVCVRYFVAIFSFLLFILLFLHLFHFVRWKRNRKSDFSVSDIFIGSFKRLHTFYLVCLFILFMFWQLAFYPFSMRARAQTRPILFFHFIFFLSFSFTYSVAFWPESIVQAKEWYFYWCIFGYKLAMNTLCKRVYPSFISLYHGPPPKPTEFPLIILFSFFSDPNWFVNGLSLFFSSFYVCICVLFSNIVQNKWTFGSPGSGCPEYPPLLYSENVWKAEEMRAKRQREMPK